MQKEKFYLSTAIAYASGKPHIGNTYEIVLADAICRFKRLEGYDVYFQTGTDEHGIKIQEKAQAAGLTPQEFVDGTAAEIRRIWDLMNTSYDRFVRTTDKMHERKVQEIFEKFLKSGDIYKGKYEGWYCTPCEAFWTQSQLVDGKCPDCGREVKWAEEEAYFFRLSRYGDRIMKHIQDHPEFIQPEARKNEMINNFLKPGLQDLCVSRTSFDWGIPVKSDPKHVVYVWLDALSNYITFPGYEPEGEGSDFYKKYWPADIHLIGKDIIRFHTIYWPAFLMALGEPLPKQVFGHPWLIMSDGKMSKSKGNVLYADDLCELYGVDAVRYFVLHEIPFASDGVISHELLIERINSDLANILGNLVNRTVSMVNKYLGGVLPGPGPIQGTDRELRDLALATPGRAAEKMATLHVADAMDEIFSLLRRANKYVDETQPWVLGRDEANRDRLGAVLYNLCESVRIAAVLLTPFMPATGEKIFSQLNLEPMGWESLSSFGAIPAGHKIGQPEILFARLDPAKKLLEVNEYYEAKNPPKTDPVLPDVTIDDFAKCDMRVCKVLSCENVKKSDKLLKFSLDDGSGKPRQILSGIAKFYKPEELVGKTVVAILNLPARKMMGLESNGMLLSAVREEDGKEKLHLLMLDDAVPAGYRLS
ncbi:MAG: methionine--tRNA ligase [Oscillospiraceae bacterium]|nr:methionine--tRNA ligase [Oscillospiraceae bacterium]